VKNAIFLEALSKTNRMFASALPILAGMLGLVGLVVSLLPEQLSKNLFSGMPFLDALEGAAIGSIATGQAGVSYILGKGLLDAGVSLTAVTALILSWVTVGFVQLPAESLMLGRGFAIWRNTVSFLLVVPVSLLIVGTLRLWL